MVVKKIGNRWVEIAQGCRSAHTCLFSFLYAKAPLPPRATWSRLQIAFFSFFWIATPQFDQNARGPIATVAGRLQNTWPYDFSNSENSDGIVTIGWNLELRHHNPKNKWKMRRRESWQHNQKSIQKNGVAAPQSKFRKQSLTRRWHPCPDRDPDPRRGKKMGKNCKTTNCVSVETQISSCRVGLQSGTESWVLFDEVIFLLQTKKKVICICTRNPMQR